MKFLKPGICTDEDLADWFGLEKKSYIALKKEKMEILKKYCDY